MSQESWNETDEFFSRQLAPADPSLESALKASVDGGLPSISVSPLQGRFLEVLAQACGARRILEIGTLGGYSTICLARGLPAEGRVITLELQQKHADVARKNLDRAGIGGKVEIRVGSALDLLPAIARNGEGPFDLIFVDADKESIDRYYEWAVKLSRPGTLILVDNVVRRIESLRSSTSDPGAQGIRRFVEIAGRDPRVKASVLQTVGAKGHDGIAFVTVVSPSVGHQPK